jgi:hypothetical protein
MKTTYINPEGYAVAAVRAGVPVKTAPASAPAVFKQVLIAGTCDASCVKRIGYPLTGWEVRAGAVKGPVNIHRAMVLCMHSACSGSIISGQTRQGKIKRPSRSTVRPRGSFYEIRNAVPPLCKKLYFFTTDLSEQIWSNSGSLRPMDLFLK